MGLIADIILLALIAVWAACVTLLLAMSYPDRFPKVVEWMESWSGWKYEGYGIRIKVGEVRLRTQDDAQ